MSPINKPENNLIQIQSFGKILQMQILINQTRFDKVAAVIFSQNWKKGINIFNY